MVRRVSMTIVARSPQGVERRYGAWSDNVGQVRSNLESRGFTIIRVISAAAPSGGVGPGTSYAAAAPHVYEAPAPGSPEAVAEQEVKQQGPSREARREMLVEYIKSKRQVPGWFEKQVEVPEEVKELGLEEEWSQASYESQWSSSPVYSGRRFERKFERTYKELPPKEQFEFGLKYDPELKEKPVSEWRQYRGASEYLKHLPTKEREAKLEEYIQSKDWESFVTSPRGKAQIEATRESIAYEGLGPLDIVTVIGVPYEKAERKLAGQMLFTKPEDTERVIWESLGFKQRGRRLLQEGVVAGALWLPSLVESGLHLGFKTPTPIRSWQQERFISYTPGLIEAPISELLTGGESKAFERLSEKPERISEAIFKTGGVLFGFAGSGQAIGIGVSKLRQGYVGSYPYWPKGLKQLRYNIKTGITTTKFKWAKFTGRGLYKEKELISRYVPGQWQELPYNIMTRGVPKSQRFLFTGKGKPIALETYTPVLPGRGGRIVDVGRYPVYKPRIDVKPSRWFVTPRDSYWIKITQPPKTFFKFPKPSISKDVLINGKGLIPVTKGKLTTFTKDVGVTRGFVPSAVKYPSITRGLGFRMLGGWAIATGGVSLATLEFLEEGIQYVHPRWKMRDVKTPVVSLQPETKVGLIKELKIGQDIRIDLTSGLQFERVAVGKALKKDVFSRSLWTQEFSRVSATIPILLSKQVQQQAQTQTQAQVQAFLSPLKYGRVVTPRLSKMPSRIPGKRKFVIPFLLPDGVSKRTGTKKAEDGYYVKVKTRQYVRGKSVGKEKFRFLNPRNPYNYLDSMSLLGSGLDHSIAQTGYIVPSGKPAQKLRKHLPSSWQGISHKFYKKNGKYVEDRAFAIDTRGESRELNVFKWWRGLPQKQQIKQIEKGRGLNLDFPGLDMYGFDIFQTRFKRKLRRMRIL